MHVTVNQTAIFQVFLGYCEFVRQSNMWRCKLKMNYKGTYNACTTQSSTHFSIVNLTLELT